MITHLTWSKHRLDVSESDKRTSLIYIIKKLLLRPKSYKSGWLSMNINQSDFHHETLRVSFSGYCQLHLKTLGL